MRSPRADIIVLGVLFVGVLLVRGAAAGATHDVGIDGGVYLDVARHVRDGHGLSASLSPYNAGYPSFPHPSPLYPLWPLILGVAASVMPLREAAHWLPFSFYLAAGVAWFFAGRRLAGGPLLGSWTGLHGGHAAALVIWLNPVLSVWSVRPYTEPLAWLLVGIAVWRFAALARDPRLRSAVEVGVWAAFPYFARAQLLIVPLALFSGLLLWVVLGPDRARRARWAAAALAPTVILLGAWYARLATFLHDPSPAVLLRFDSAQATDLLPRLAVVVDTDGLWGLVADRAAGIEIAWGRGADSWWEIFFGLQYFLPLAMAVGLLRLAWHGAPAVRAGWERFRSGEGALHGTLWALAAGGLLSVHLVHKQFSSPWYFDQREGLAALPAFLFPALWLLRGAWPGRVLAGGLLLFTFYHGWGPFLRGATLEDRPAPRTAYDRLATWLSTRAAGRPEPLVVAVEEGLAQRTAWQTENVGVHWVSTRSSYASVMTMFSGLGAELLVYDKPRDSWPFLRAGGRVQAQFERLKGVPAGYTALTPRAVPLTAAAPRQVLLIGTEGKAGGLVGYARLELAPTQVPGAERWRVALSGRSDGGVTVDDWAASRGLVVDGGGWGNAAAAAAFDPALPAMLTLRTVPDLASARVLAEAVPEEVTVLVLLVPDATAPGALLLKGPDVPPVQASRGGRLGDVAPTVAWLLGLPVARSLGGEVRADLLSWDAAGALGRADVDVWSESAEAPIRR